MELTKHQIKELERIANVYISADGKSYNRNTRDESAYGWDAIPEKWIEELSGEDNDPEADEWDELNAN